MTGIDCLPTTSLPHTLPFTHHKPISSYR